MQKLCFEVKQRKRGERQRARGVKNRLFFNLVIPAHFVCSWEWSVVEKTKGWEERERERLLEEVLLHLTDIQCLLRVRHCLDARRRAPMAQMMLPLPGV